MAALQTKTPSSSYETKIRATDPPQNDGDHSSGFNPTSSYQSTTLPVVDRDDIAFVNQHGFTSTTTQSSMGRDTFETPPTPQSNAQARQKTTLEERSDADGRLSTSSEFSLARRRSFELRNSVVDSLSSSGRSSAEGFDFAPIASHLTDGSIEQESEQTKTIPSSEWKEPRWPSPTQYPDTETAAAIYDETEQEPPIAWYRSRLLERVSISGTTSSSLRESIGSQFQRDEIPIAEEVIAVIDYTRVQQERLR